MPGVQIYAAGKVTNDFTFVQSQKGPKHDFLSFSMAHNNGFFGDDGSWVQTSTLWLNVKAFGSLARNARGAVAKGRPLMVHGELRHEPYLGPDGQKRNSLELRADAIGLNLRFCGAQYTGHGERTRESPEDGAAVGAVPGNGTGTSPEADTGADTRMDAGAGAAVGDGAGALVAVGGRGEAERGDVPGF